MTHLVKISVSTHYHKVSYIILKLVYSYNEAWKSLSIENVGLSVALLTVLRGSL